ncbi:hypothetical protein BLA29_011956, partial [Euroglyphus maynei]
MSFKSFILVVPILFFSCNAAAAKSSGGTKTTASTAKLSQQMNRLLPEHSPSTSPTAIPDNNNFRDSLRYKMKLVNDAIHYG